jgi:hypothetical protein
MLFNPEHEGRLARLADELRRAPAITPDLMTNVITGSGTRSAVPISGGRATRIDQLIDAGAWIDVAFALIEIGLPAWTLRRLVYEDGRWFCSLSRHPNLPTELDDTADGDHEVLPLAILNALVEARCKASASDGNRSPKTRQVSPSASRAACCDNFA